MPGPGRGTWSGDERRRGSVGMGSGGGGWRGRGPSYRRPPPRGVASTLGSPHTNPSHPETAPHSTPKGCCWRSLGFTLRPFLTHLPLWWVQAPQASLTPKSPRNCFSPSIEGLPTKDFPSNDPWLAGRRKGPRTSSIGTDGNSGIGGKGGE